MVTQPIIFANLFVQWGSKCGHPNTRTISIPDFSVFVSYGNPVTNIDRVWLKPPPNEMTTRMQMAISKMLIFLG